MLTIDFLKQPMSLSTPSSNAKNQNPNTTANNFKRSSLVRSSLKTMADKSPESQKGQKCPTENNDQVSISSSLSTPAPSIQDLILRSSLFQTSQLSVNIVEEMAVEHIFFEKVKNYILYKLY